jgi:hypothetical protein
VGQPEGPRSPRRGLEIVEAFQRSILKLISRNPRPADGGCRRLPPKPLAERPAGGTGLADRRVHVQHLLRKPTSPCSSCRAGRKHCWERCSTSPAGRRAGRTGRQDRQTGQGRGSARWAGEGGQLLCLARRAIAAGSLVSFAAPRAGLDGSTGKPWLLACMGLWAGGGRGGREVGGEGGGSGGRRAWRDCRAGLGLQRASIHPSIPSCLLDLGWVCSSRRGRSGSGWLQLWPLQEKWWREPERRPAVPQLACVGHHRAGRSHLPHRPIHTCRT